MVRKLEQSWRHSCAVFSGKKILWVINWTLSTETKTAYEFSQELMVLLRENVFRAGGRSIIYPPDNAVPTNESDQRTDGTGPG